MKPKTFMIIAGEPSGDTLAAELVRALRVELPRREGASPDPHLQPLRTALEPRFFGAGGKAMAEAGVEVGLDMTRHAVVGLVEVLKNYAQFKRMFDQLLRWAIERQPEAIVCVDFSGFNRRFAHALKQHVRQNQGPFHNWNPKIIQYVSPQVWASRPGRADAMAQDYDLVLSIFPFEREWYAKRAPDLRVEFVGHPMVDRHAGSARTAGAVGDAGARRSDAARPPFVLLLPGSRVGELKRHLPVMLGALERMRAVRPDLRARMVLPGESIAELARTMVQAHSPTGRPPPDLELGVGDLASALAETDLAIASTGTVTMECAYFGVPTVAIYKTSWSTYEIGKRIIQVKHLAMPNLLAGRAVFPELIQGAATAEGIARESLELLNDPARRTMIQAELARVIASLGAPGASLRAARAIAQIL